VGDELVFDEDVCCSEADHRLLVANDIGGVRESLEWIRDDLSPRVAVR